MVHRQQLESMESSRALLLTCGGADSRCNERWSELTSTRLRSVVLTFGDLGSSRATFSRVVALLFGCIVSGHAFAGEPGRTANVTLRELTTDRPDATESPFTVDRDHLQVEMDAASYTRNRLDGVRTTEWAFAPFNLRYGIANNVEAGIFVVPHLRVTEEPRGEAKTRHSGAGDTLLRMTFNFRGNEGGPTALALMADVKVPTAASGLGNDKTEGALTFPVAYELGAGWSGAAMTSVEFLHTERGRRAIWANTITFARELMPDVGGFLELTSAVGDGAHVATFNFGVTRAFGPRLQLDCGVNVGISRTAPDLTVFAGLARKF